MDTAAQVHAQFLAAGGQDLGDIYRVGQDGGPFHPVVNAGFSQFFEAKAHEPDALGEGKPPVSQKIDAPVPDNGKPQRHGAVCG